MGRSHACKQEAGARTLRGEVLAAVRSHRGEFGSVGRELVAHVEEADGVAPPPDKGVVVGVKHNLAFGRLDRRGGLGVGAGNLQTSTERNERVLHGDPVRGACL